MTPLFTLAQAAAWLPGAQSVGDTAVAVQRVHTDSRSLQAGDLFVALKGVRYDAHDFLAAAQQAGATAVLCQPEGLAQLQALGLPGLVVPDTLHALGSLATAWRSQFNLPLIAVTGSNGKTTVTQMIASILQAAEPNAWLATQGNLNNEIGVPLTLLRLTEQHRLAVVELGMNHPGEIARLAAMAQPTVALVNNAQREHLEFMATVDAVAQENAAVLQALDQVGWAVFPADDEFTPLWQRLAADRPCLRFALAPHGAADVVCTQARWHQNAWQVSVQSPAGTLRYQLQVAGQHNLKNSLAALTCALAAGVPAAAIAQGLNAFVPVAGRSRTLRLEQHGKALTLIDDSYNANPDSVRAAIDLLATLPAPRLLVLGDMGEVGTQGPQFHAEVGAYAQQRGLEQLFTFGTLAQCSAAAFGAAHHFENSEALQAATLRALPHLASVLVKGSRFMRMERVVAAITAHCANPQEKFHVA